MYKECNPENLSKVSKLMEDHEGREAGLLVKARRQSPFLVL